MENATVSLVIHSCSVTKLNSTVEVGYFNTFNIGKVEILVNYNIKYTPKVH